MSSGDAWLRDDRDLRAEPEAAGRRRRAQRWAAILDLHGDGVISWTGPTLGRLEPIVSRLNAWLDRAVGRRRKAASSWPWRRWHGVLVAPLTRADLADRDPAESPHGTAGRRWLDRRRPGAWLS